MPSSIHEFRAACQALGVPETATPGEIRQAYRDLVQIWHPDRIQGDRLKAIAERKLKEINAAYKRAQHGAPAPESPADTADTAGHWHHTVDIGYPQACHCQSAVDHEYPPGDTHGIREAWRRRTRTRPQRRPSLAFFRRRYPSPLRILMLCLPVAGALLLFGAIRGIPHVQSSPPVTGRIVSYVMSGPAALTAATLEAALGRGAAGLHPARALSPFDDLGTAIESLFTWQSIQAAPPATVAPAAVVPPLFLGIPSVHPLSVSGAYRLGIPSVHPLSVSGAYRLGIPHVQTSVPVTSRIGRKPIPRTRAARVEIESPVAFSTGGVLRVENASEHRSTLQFLNESGYNLRTVLLDPDSTAVFRGIPVGRYFLAARAGSRIRRIGPFDYYRFQDGSGIRSSEYAVSLE